MPKLLIIIASTRPGRVGLPVGRWFRDQAVLHGGFEVRVADLAEINLPFMDEPSHPRMRKYTHPHTKAWSARVEAADAFVLVMPEYNFGYTAPLKNALDYLYHEWVHKAVGLVSYGAIAGGTRAQQLLRPVLNYLYMVPATEAVIIPFVSRFINDQGVFVPDERVQNSVKVMLDEILELDRALRTLRN